MVELLHNFQESYANSKSFVADDIRDITYNERQGFAVRSSARTHQYRVNIIYDHT